MFRGKRSIGVRKRDERREISIKESGMRVGRSEEFSFFS